MKNWLKTWKGKIIALALVLVLALPTMIILQRAYRILTKLEFQLLDFRFDIRGYEKPWQDIVIVEIDNSSMDRLSVWPWPRTLYCEVIKTLNQYGAKAIGLDILFDSDSSINPAHDELFAETLKNNPNVVLASKRFDDQRHQFSVTSYSIPIPKLREHASYGFVNQEMDPDNIIRKAFLFFKENQNEPPNFSWDLKLLQKSLGLPDSALQINSRDKCVELGDYKIPIGRHGTIRINYAGPNRTFPIIPFYQVYDKTYKNMDIFKNKIVLIGSTAPILHDVFFTPYKDISGVEIHANTIHTILSQNYLKQIDPFLAFLTTLIIVILIGYISLHNKAFVGLSISLGILILYSFGVIWLFNNYRLLLVWAHPIVLGALCYGVIVFIRFIHEEKSKKQMKDMFQQYVSPSVVDELIKNPDKLKLGGEKREMTVFFSDVRSFTTYSENHTPEQVVEVLNEYLDAMTHVIFKWEGTLDKYVGDEIMAVWGAPLWIPNHAELALRCCWEQLAVLRECQRRWISEGRDILDIGMGLNTGEMITGNIGSSVHKDYTVIGDAVNLGARLEAETRHHGTPENPCYLIISEFTYAHVKDICTVKSLGDVKVKGKNKPVEIYEVLAVKDMPNPLAPVAPLAPRLERQGNEE